MIKIPRYIKQPGMSAFDGSPMSWTFLVILENKRVLVCCPNGHHFRPPHSFKDDGEAYNPDGGSESMPCPEKECSFHPSKVYLEDWEP